MRNVNYHTAIYKGARLTNHVKAWSKLIGRSSTYVYNRLKIAEERNLENLMQYVIDVHTGKLPEPAFKHKVKRVNTRASAADGNRLTKEQKFNKLIAVHIKNFIYPRSAIQTEKMEHVCQI